MRSYQGILCFELAHAFFTKKVEPLKESFSNCQAHTTALMCTTYYCHKKGERKEKKENSDPDSLSELAEMKKKKKNYLDQLIKI